MASEQLQAITLENSAGSRAIVTNYGATLMSLIVPDQAGNFNDVVHGFDEPKAYQADGVPYFGCICGRYANRIGNGGKFTLEGKEYSLFLNNEPDGKPCALHGGKVGFDKKVWNVLSSSANTVAMQLVSPDMEEGYPGTVTITVTYTLADENELRIDYSATTDRTTVLAPTNHSYFNLAGSGDILEHQLQLNSTHFTPVDSGMIPVGTVEPVASTPFDFTKPRPIGEKIDEQNEQLLFGNGYDHNFVIDRPQGDLKTLVPAARVVEPKSGRVMEVLTTEPGVQLYTGNFLPSGNAQPLKGKNGAEYTRRTAFCLETQHFPDSPNKPQFPTTVLAAGAQLESTTVYKFSVLTNNSP